MTRILVAMSGLLLAAPAFAIQEVQVPEPASLSVLAVAAGAVAVARFWRK